MLAARMGAAEAAAHQLVLTLASATFCVAVRDGAYGQDRAPDTAERVAETNFAKPLSGQVRIAPFMFDRSFAARLPGERR